MQVTIYQAGRSSERGCHSLPDKLVYTSVERRRLIMNNNPNPRWLILQGLAIVGSILLAFVIEAWWSDRQEAEEAAQILTALQLEIVANLEEIKRLRLYRVAVSDVCHAILAAKIDRIDKAGFDAHLADLVWWRRANLALGALSSLVEGGKLALVKDPKVVLQISGVRDRLVGLIDLEQEEKYTTRRELIPFLYRNGSMPQISNVATKRGEPGLGDWTPSPTVADDGERDHRNFLVSDEFRGVVLLKKWAQEDALTQYERTEAAMNGLIALLSES